MHTWSLALRSTSPGPSVILASHAATAYGPDGDSANTCFRPLPMRPPCMLTWLSAMVRMHSIASSRLVSSSGGFRDRPSCLSTGRLSSELPAAHRRRVLLLLSFRALLGSLLSPFGSFLCPFGSLLSPFGSFLYAKSTARCTSQTGRSRAVCGRAPPAAHRRRVGLVCAMCARVCHGGACA